MRSPVLLFIPTTFELPPGGQLFFGGNCRSGETGILESRPHGGRRSVRVEAGTTSSVASLIFHPAGEVEKPVLIGEFR